MPVVGVLTNFSYAATSQSWATTAMAMHRRSTRPDKDKEQNLLEQKNILGQFVIKECGN